MELVCTIVISVLSSLLGLVLLFVAGYFVRQKCKQTKLKRQNTKNSGMVTIGRRRTTNRNANHEFCQPQNNNPYPNLNQRSSQRTRPNLYACHPATPNNVIPVIRITNDDDVISVNSSTYANIKRADASIVSGEYANLDENPVPANSKPNFNVDQEPVYVLPVNAVRPSNNTEYQAMIPILGMRGRLASAIRSIPTRLSTNVFSLTSTPANSPHSSHSSHSQEEEGEYLSFQGNSTVNLTPKI